VQIGVIADAVSLDNGTKRERQQYNCREREKQDSEEPTSPSPLQGPDARRAHFQMRGLGRGANDRRI
jgi:hypothetical protein